MIVLNDSENLTVENIERLVELNPYFVKETYQDKTFVYYTLCVGENTVESRVAIAMYLIEKGANADHMSARGDTPLHMFSKFGCIYGVRMLLDKGAGPNCRGAFGKTSLHFVTYSGKVDCARLLIDRGADKDCEDKNGCTPSCTE